MRHEALRLAKKHKRLQGHELLILNETLSQDSDNEAPEMLETVAAVNNTAAEAEDALFLEESLALLTLQQRRVIAALVLDGATEHEVAAELGVSQTAVHQMKKRALNRLRRYLVVNRVTPKGSD